MRVAIIGAGINGLYLAWKLSESGHRVTVFEKKEKIGKKACSGLFSDRILDFIPESRRVIENEIDSVFIHFPKKTIKVIPKRKFFLMNHAELDRLMAELAKKEGAEILLGHPLEGTDPIRNLISNGASRIIGCDGYDSFIRKSLSLSAPRFRFTIQGFLGKEDYSNHVETWAVKDGFLWKIPRGKETEYGVIARPKEARAILNDFLKKNNLKIERELASVIPQGFVIPENSSTTLCGDAVGLTKPWSGGGVVWGLMAASILLKNFPDFIKYRNKMKRFFLPNIIFSELGTRVVYFFGFNFPWLLPEKVKIEGDFLI